jgi:putative autotransporter adhesin-like protein
LLARTVPSGLALVAALLLVACGTGKKGSGHEASETRSVGSFSRISLGAETDVVVTVGQTPRVVVRGDDNLLADIHTKVEGGTLTISQPENVDLRPKKGLIVEITVQELEEVVVTGSGDVKIEGIHGGSLRVEVSGAGEVDASGSVDRVEVVVSGAGDIHMDKLVARDAQVVVSGAGDVEVQATGSLDATVSGAGDITYTGNPASVQEHVSGAGSVSPG